MVKQRKGVKEELITPIKPMETKTTKPTPEQMRIAQILEKKVVDSTIKLKLKQIMDATQRPAEEVYVALHDSDFDVNRAVNLLIEGEDQLADWCTNEKRKKKLAELKEKKEEVEVDSSMPEKNNAVGGRGDDKRRPGRRQDGGKRLPKQEVEQRKQQGVAPRVRRPGFGSMVFERSNPPPIDTGLLPPIKNHWEKPLVCARSADDDWDLEEFQGSLSQTQIFTSSKKHESPEIQRVTPKETSPRPGPPLPSLTFTNKALEHEEVIASPVTPQKRDLFTDIRPNVTSTHDAASLLPTESRADLFRLSYTKSNEDRRPSSKIPTSAVEMPPELMPSLSFLDIQFGAIDLCSLESSSESQSNATSQNPSATTLMPPSSTASSCGMTHLMGNISVSSVSSNKTSSHTNATKCSPLAPVPCPDSAGMDVANSQSKNIVTSQPGLNPVTSSIANTTLSNVNQNLNSTPHTVNCSSIDNPGLSSSNSVPSSSISSSISHIITQNSIQQGTNMASSNNAPNATSMVPNNMNHHMIGPSATNPNRYMPSSQVFNGSHLQYGIINPPGSSHGYESRDSGPPPHLPQPHSHLPPFKSPPGVPKGTMVPSLPPGSIVSNQFLVSQGNVPYFPHQPIYYYEEVPPMMNSQQRLTNMTSHTHHYDVSYQSAPSSRDSVHYNV